MRTRPLAYVLGVGLAASAGAALTRPQLATFHAKGPLGPWHENVACEACHRPAPGSLRQQLQANLRYALGWRKAPVAFGTQPVDNQACVDCHVRSDDRHPTHLFLEPRFEKVRATLKPHQCVACHREHTSQRVTLNDLSFCGPCHDEVELKGDPIKPTHAELAKRNQFEGCLGCHDYHRNHAHKAPRKNEAALPIEAVRSYFQNGPDAYGRPLREPARTTPLSRGGGAP